MICPKCKTENDENALVCSHCGFKLKLKCPYCNSFNVIGAKNCTSCGKQLLKVCPACKAVNFSNAEVCRKCSTPFPQKEQAKSETQNQERVKSLKKTLEEAAFVAVELINIPSIKTNVKSPEIAKKIIAKFYQIFAKAAKEKNIRALKITNNILYASFDNAASLIDSINSAIDYVWVLNSAIDDVSRLLEKKVNISYKVRYLVATYKPTQKEEITSAVGLGVVDDVIFSDTVYPYIKDKMPFREITDSKGHKFYKFLNQDDPETIISEAPKEQLLPARAEIRNEILKNIELIPNGYITCVNGPLGVGKSNLFNLLRMTFEEDNSYIWLLGQCSLQAKNAPLFFFKDLLQNLFDIPAFNIDIETTKKKVFTYLSEKLNITDENLVNNIFAILFFDESRLQKSIYDNKQASYKAIASIFRALLSKGAVALQIEDIENIDTFSLEIMRNLFDEGILQCNLKIFITSNLDVDIKDFIASSQLNKDNCTFLQFPVMNKAEIDDFIIKAIGVREELGDNVLNNIYSNANGFPIFIEEFLYLLLQLGLIRFTTDNLHPLSISSELAKFTFPTTIQDLIQLRLTNVSNARPEAFKALYYASILGFKFLPVIVQNILQVNDETFEGIIKFLSVNNFITPFDSYNYTFKSRIMWETVRNLKLSPENKVTGVTSSIKTLVQLSMPDMATVVHNLADVSVPKTEMINYIEQATKDAYAVGDDYSYIYHKTLLLDAVEESTIENKEAIMLSIKEELVNLAYITFPDTAIRFADELVSYYEPLDTAKTIDILGLMTVAFENTGNYLAALECVDKALEKIDANTNQLASILLHYSKLNSLLQLGRYEELVTLAKTTILPTIELFKNGKIQDTTTLSPEQLFNAELETKYMYSLALTLQGSLSANEAIQNLYNSANEYQNTDYTLKAQLVNGIYKVIQGEINEIQSILEATKDVIPQSKDSTANTLIWLLIRNIAKYLKGEYANLKAEFLMMANFCQNIREFTIEPIIKGLVVSLSLREGQIDYAQNLAYEQYYKCANNQWALGALMNWYMYCDICIYQEKYDDAMKVAQNAIDVAEKANINNLFFEALLKLKLAEIFALRKDFDMAKINAQEAAQLADMNNFVYIKANLGITYYDILVNQIADNPSMKNENIKTLYKYLLFSAQAAEKLQNQEIILRLKQQLESIIEFAQNNNISLE